MGVCVWLGICVAIRHMSEGVKLSKNVRNNKNSNFDLSLILTSKHANLTISRGIWGSILLTISQGGKSIEKTFLAFHGHGTPGFGPTTVDDECQKNNQILS